jgi:hypothetical protein
VGGDEMRGTNRVAVIGRDRWPYDVMGVLHLEADHALVISPRAPHDVQKGRDMLSVHATETHGLVLRAEQVVSDDVEAEAILRALGDGVDAP